jgi:hypothetical protein
MQNGNRLLATHKDLHFEHNNYRNGWIIFRNGLTEADNVPFLAIVRCDNGFRLITLNSHAQIHKEITLFIRIVEQMEKPEKIMNSQELFYGQQDVSKMDLSLFTKKTSILIKTPQGISNPTLLIGYADSYDEGVFFKIFLY